MASFKISSFKYGLDTRKEQLDAQVGTLTVLSNAYVNEGGELLRRKLFSQVNDYSGLDSLGQSCYFPGTFVGDDFVVFGSALEYGSSASQGQPIAAGPITNQFSVDFYQQLKHPTLYNDSSETYDNTKHRMVGVIASDTFNGKTLVVAEYADGNKFLFYDGVVVQQSANGLVLFGRDTLADLSEDLARQFENISWSSTENTDETGATQNGSTMVESGQGDYFGSVLTESTANGLFSQRSIAKDEDPVSGTKATAKFAITGNSGTFTLQAPALIDTTTPLVDLCGGAVSALGSATLTAAAIATAVNDFTDFHGYSAIADAANVTVYAPLGYDVNVAIDLTVTVTTGTVGSGSGTGVELQATAASIPNPPANVNLTFSNNVATAALRITQQQANNPGSGFTISVPILLTVIGGTPGYQYQWSEDSAGSANGISISGSSTNSYCVFIKRNADVEFAYVGTFKCVIKDSSSPQLELIKRFTVNLSVRIVA